MTTTTGLPDAVRAAHALLVADQGVGAVADVLDLLEGALADDPCPTVPFADLLALHRRIGGATYHLRQILDGQPPARHLGSALDLLDQPTS